MVGSAGSVRLRGAIMQVVVNVVGHGLPVDEAIDLPRVHVDEPHVHCEGGLDPAALDALEAAGYDVVRWRRRNLFFGGGSGRRATRGRQPRRCRRPTPGRIRRGRGMSDFAVREAVPADAPALVALAQEVGAEPEGWLIADDSWRGVADERRYLKALRRHPHAAVFVVEDDDRIVGRLSVARDPHPASFHVADLGLMVATGPPAPRRRPCTARAGGRMGARRRASASSSFTSFRTTSPRSPSTRASASSARASGASTTAVEPGTSTRF